VTGNLKPSDIASLGDGMHGDGNYLWLRVKGAARSWIVRGPRINGKKPEAGLGSVNRVSLHLARKERDKLVEQWQNGKDPVAERRAAREAQANRKTFAEVARLKIEAKRSGWRTSFEGKTTSLDIWTKTMEVDCGPIANKAIDEIGVDDIKRIVSPYWDRGCLKAGYDLVKRIEAVFDYAIAHGWRSAANPAAWSVFKQLWPAPPAKKPHAALPWQDVPAFLRELRASPVVGADVVEFAILTATRSGETRGAKWSEINFEAKTWAIPPSRLKTGKKRHADDPHVVPLSEQAIALLERVKAEGVAGDCVFPGYVNDGSRTKRDTRPIPAANVWRLVKRLGGDVDITVHGFRASFKTWCGDHGQDRELAEHSLSHELGNEAERVYLRSRLVARRAPLMQEWADYCGGAPSDNVLPFKRSA
jgi:integrase